MERARGYAGWPAPAPTAKSLEEGGNEEKKTTQITKLLGAGDVSPHIRSRQHMNKRLKRFCPNHYNVAAPSKNNQTILE